MECEPATASQPRLLMFNAELAEELRIDLQQATDEQLAVLFAGNQLPSDARPLAQAYAGHQFGGFVPQLGDGRALLLGEVIDRNGQRRDIALKGSGLTPFSRGGDGKAVVGPVLREYLIGEAMHALAVPTTRALAAVATGESVHRERPLPGAVLTRVASSHIRVGTFEFFAARKRYDQVQTLADYVIARHVPQLAEQEDRYLELFQAVVQRQAQLIANWMLVGFIHGVMNTDNTTISGETIDYGPCAFMEAYSPEAVFSSIDQHGRYAYGNQPGIARWNLARFAETLLPLRREEPQDAVPLAMEALERFAPIFEQAWLAGVRAKLGLPNEVDQQHDAADQTLAEDWLGLLEQYSVDFTLAWRRLADVLDGDSAGLESLFPSPDVPQPWLTRWRQRLGENATTDTAKTMRQTNPIYIPRNHLVEEALAAATDKDDLEPFRQLLEAVTHPYQRRDPWQAYSQPAPQEYTACYRTFCGT